MKVRSAKRESRDSLESAFERKFSKFIKQLPKGQKEIEERSGKENGLNKFGFWFKPNTLLNLKAEH